MEEEDVTAFCKPKDTEVVVPTCCLCRALATGLAATGWATAAVLLTERWPHRSLNLSPWAG
jgi:hypothetical protein